MVTVLWTMGLLVATGHTVHIMSSMIPIFLLPIAILDSIHVLSEYDERLAGTSRAENIIRVYEELARPLALTSVTTAIGFGSLAFTPIPPVRTFGIFVAVGVLIAWLLTMVLLPVLLMRIAPRSGGARRAHTLTARMVRRTGRISTTHRRTVLGVAGVMAALAVFGIGRLEVNDDPVEWFRADHPVRADAELLDSKLAGTASLNLVVDGEPGDLFAPSTVRSVHRLAAELGRLPQVGSVADYTQLTPGDPMTSLLVTADGSRANLWLRLHDGDNRTVQQVVDRAEQSLARSGLPHDLRTEWAGQAFVNLTWQEQMVSGMTRSFLMALCLLTLVLTGLFRSLRWGLLAMLPVVGTVLVVYGFLGWIGADFDMPTAVLSSLSLGIGVDFAIHFVSRFRTLLGRTGDPRAAVVAFMEEPGRALTRNALVVAVGFLPLLLADLVPYVLVGVLLAGIMLLSWLTTMTVLPALVVGRTADRPSSSDRPEPAPEREVGVPALSGS